MPLIVKVPWLTNQHIAIHNLVELVVSPTVGTAVPSFVAAAAADSAPLSTTGRGWSFLLAGRLPYADGHCWACHTIHWCVLVIRNSPHRASAANKQGTMNSLRPRSVTRGGAGGAGWDLCCCPSPCVNFFDRNRAGPPGWEVSTATHHPASPRHNRWWQWWQWQHQQWQRCSGGWGRPDAVSTLCLCVQSDHRHQQFVSLLFVQFFCSVV